MKGILLSVFGWWAAAEAAKRAAIVALAVAVLSYAAGVGDDAVALINSQVSALDPTVAALLCKFGITSVLSTLLWLSSVALFYMASEWAYRAIKG